MIRAAQIIIAGSILGLLLFAVKARADGFCAPVPIMLEQLMKGFNEHVIIKGEDMILTRSHQGSWTVLEIRKGVACIVLSGAASEVNAGI